eukprot:763731-Hanusia_phi.AAC.5
MFSYLVSISVSRSWSDRRGVRRGVVGRGTHQSLYAGLFQENTCKITWWGHETRVGTQKEGVGVDVGVSSAGVQGTSRLFAVAAREMHGCDNEGLNMAAVMSHGCCLNEADQEKSTRPVEENLPIVCIEERINRIKNFCVFRAREIWPSCLQEVASQMSEVTLEEGTTVTKKGQPGYDMYWIISGSCTCTLDNEEIDHLKTGRCFGEVTVVELCKRLLNGESLASASNQCLRTADIQTLEQCHLLKLSYMDMLPLIRRIPNLWCSLDEMSRINLSKVERIRQRDLSNKSLDVMEVEEKLAALLASPCVISRHVDPSCLKTIARKLQVCAVEEGEQILIQGQFGEHMYWVVSGTLSCSADGVEIDTLSRGQCFGEISLVKLCRLRRNGVSESEIRNKCARTADIRAVDKSVVLKLNYNDALFLMRTAPNLWCSLEDLSKQRSTRMERLCTVDNGIPTSRNRERSVNYETGITKQCRSSSTEEQALRSHLR